MSRLFTIFLGLLAVGAIVFLAIYEPLTRSTREQNAANLDGRVLNLDPAGVKEIRLSSPAGELQIKRKGDGWQLGPKPKDRASSALVEKLLSTAANLQFFDRIEGRELHDDDQWGEFGLRNPKRRIEFKGEQDVTLFLGKDAADETRLYVLSSASRDIFLVSDDILEVAFPDVSKFRDRRLTDLKPDQIDRVIIRRPGGEIELLHDVRGWRMTRPLSAEADEKAVTDYLTGLLGIGIQDFVADDTGDLGSYGIVEGQREVSVYTDGKDRALTLRLGSPTGTSVFGQFTGRDSVYKLPADVVRLLDPTPEYFRDRRLLPLNLDLVDLIRFRLPGGEFIVRRGGDGWVLIQDGRTKPASSAAVQTLADAVSTARVVSYLPAVGDKVANAGLSAPRCQVEFCSVLSENTPEAAAGERVIASVAFGRVEAGNVYARLEDAPEIVLLPEAILNALPLDPASWAAPK